LTSFANFGGLPQTNIGLTQIVPNLILSNNSSIIWSAVGCGSDFSIAFDRRLSTKQTSIFNKIPFDLSKSPLILTNFPLNFAISRERGSFKSKILSQTKWIKNLRQSELEKGEGRIQ
jgi:hypothetical protein